MHACTCACISDSLTTKVIFMGRLQGKCRRSQVQPGDEMGPWTCVHVHACMCVYLHDCWYGQLIHVCSLSEFLLTLQEQPGSSLTIWKKSLTLTNEDRRLLLTGEWLTASHISAAQHLLKRKFSMQCGLCDTHYLSEKFVWSSSKDAFVQIIYVSGNHWACLSNVFCEEENVVDLYDSMPGDVSSSIKVQAATILHCQAPSFTIRVVNVQHQEGGDSCGLFAIAMAYDLCNRQDPFVSTYNESRLRPHLQRCFQQEKISQFPGGNQRRKRKRILHEITVDVFCSCRYPDIDVTTHLGNMACCSVCDEWFHEECEDIADSVFTEPETTKWVCSSCNKQL